MHSPIDPACLWMLADPIEATLPDPHSTADQADEAEPPEWVQNAVSAFGEGDHKLRLLSPDGTRVAVESPGSRSGPPRVILYSVDPKRQKLKVVRSEAIHGLFGLWNETFSADGDFAYLELSYFGVWRVQVLRCDPAAKKLGFGVLKGKDERLSWNKTLRLTTDAHTHTFDPATGVVRLARHIAKPTLEHDHQTNIHSTASQNDTEALYASGLEPTAIAAVLARYLGVPVTPATVEATLATRTPRDLKYLRSRARDNDLDTSGWSAAQRKQFAMPPRPPPKATDVPEMRVQVDAEWFRAKTPYGVVLGKVGAQRIVELDCGPCIRVPQKRLLPIKANDRYEQARVDRVAFRALCEDAVASDEGVFEFSDAGLFGLGRSLTENDFVSLMLDTAAVAQDRRNASGIATCIQAIQLRVRFEALTAKDLPPAPVWSWGQLPSGDDTRLDKRWPGALFNRYWAFMTGDGCGLLLESIENADPSDVWGQVQLHPNRAVARVPSQFVGNRLFIDSKGHWCDPNWGASWHTFGRDGDQWRKDLAGSLSRLRSG